MFMDQNTFCKDISSSQIALYTQRNSNENSSKLVFVVTDKLIVNFTCKCKESRLVKNFTQ